MCCNVTEVKEPAAHFALIYDKESWSSAGPAAVRMPRLAKTWPDSGCSTFSLPHPQSSASIKKMALIPQKHSYGSPCSGRMWHRAAPRGAHVLTAISTHPVHPFGVWQLEGCSPTPSVQTDTGLHGLALLCWKSRGDAKTLHRLEGIITPLFVLLCFVLHLNPVLQVKNSLVSLGKICWLC